MSTAFSLGQDSIKGPAGFQSILQAAFANSQALCPLTPGQVEAVMLDTQSRFAHTSQSSVALLFTTRCPSTVLGTVPPAVVDSVQCLVVGSVPHISVERRERRFPRITDSNAASPIIVKVRVFVVSASLHHGFPALIFWCMRHTVYMAAVQAPTRKPIAMSQVPSKPCKNATTVACAQPAEPAVIKSNGGNSKHTTKYLTRKIMRTGIKRYNQGCHFDTFRIELARRARGRHPRLPPILALLRG